MFKNFFEARDAWDAELLAEAEVTRGERSIQTPYALFRVLLEHTIFDPKSPAYGWVTDKHTAQETLGKLMGITRRQTIARALSDLEDMYLIKRYRVRNGKPGSPPDRIKITWEKMQAEDAPSEGAQSALSESQETECTESAPSERKAHPLEGAESALSYTSKKGLEELTKKNANEGRSPSGDTTTTEEDQTPKTLGETPRPPARSQEDVQLDLKHAQEELDAARENLEHPQEEPGSGRRPRNWSHVVSRLESEVGRLEEELGRLQRDDEGIAQFAEEPRSAGEGGEWDSRELYR